MNEYSVGTVVSLDVDKATQKLDKLIDKLNKTNRALGLIYNATGINGLNKQLDTMIGHLETIEKNTGMSKQTKSIESFNKSASKTSDMLKKINNNLKLPNLQALITTMKQLATTFTKAIDQSSSYIENLNMMQVAFGETRKEAESFVNGLADIFGIDESTLTRQLGFYKQIGNALAIDSEYAEMFAKNLLKLQLDMSSLYNLSFQKSGEVLQSSIAGQTKPIRGSAGGDITQSTLQTDLDRLGIDRSITELNRAEKAILIYLSLERQLIASNQDLAKTINSTANQQKIFSEQVNRLARALGNVLTPALNSVLYILNGFLMVLVELINMFAIFIGFEIPEYDPNSYKTWEDLDEIIGDTTEGIGELEDKIKGLRGFDKLNVIKTPSSDSGSGNIASGGVDQRLLDALKEYDLGLDSVQNKATQIRDRIMEWLGFTKEVSEATGEITWKLEDGYTNLWKMLDVAKILGLTFLGFKFGGLTGGIIGLVAGLGVAIATSEELRKALENIGGSMSASFGLDFSTSGTETFSLLQELFETFMEFGQETFIPYLEELGSAFTVFAETLAEVLVPIFNDAILPAFNLLLEIIIDIFETMNTIWAEVGEPVFLAFNEAIQLLGEVFNNLWKTILKPIFDNIIKKGKETWEQTLQPMFEKIGIAIGKIEELILVLWNKVLAPLVNFIIDTFGPSIVSVVNTIGNIFNTVFNFVGKIINGFLDSMIGIIDFLIGVFTGDWERAWQGLVSAVAPIGNAIISIFESVVNGIIDLFNGMISFVLNGLKKFINSILGVVEGVADLIGVDLDLKIKGEPPKIGHISVPRIPTYQEGGFPEDGWFRASKNELVGKWDDGSSVVASNKQITEGIRQATKDGMMDALMVASKQKQPIQVNIVAEDNDLLNGITFKQFERDRQYGM